jgi:DNA-binding FrmR family transcriptional regulator
MDENKAEIKDDMLNRLRRIEGQVKGIQKMVEGEKCCSEILTQVAAVRAAINKVGCIILEHYSTACINNAISAEDRDKALDELHKTIQSFMKFAD